MSLDRYFQRGEVNGARKTQITRVVPQWPAGIRTEQVKRVRITFFSFVFSKFFTLWREQFL